MKTDERISALEYEIMELRASISRERSDERSQTILDMRRYLADGLRKLGIEADDKIALTEVLALFEEMQKDNRTLVNALQEIAGGIRETSSDGSDYADGVLSATCYTSDIAERALFNVGVVIDSEAQS